MMMDKKLLKLSQLLMLCYVIFCFSKETHATTLSGTYTINPSLPATGSNFKNFASAVSYLTGAGTRTDGGADNTAPFGISGAVTFNIAAGTYLETLYLDGNLIPGISSANRITFNGGSAQTTSLVYDTGAAVVQLVACNFITIRNISITNPAQVNARGIVIASDISGSNNGTGCSIKNCRIELQSSDYTAINMMLTDIYQDPWGSTFRGDSIEIDSNVMIGGGTGIALRGLGSYLNNRGLKFRYNHIVTQATLAVSFSSVYNGIEFSYNDVDNAGLNGTTIQTQDVITFSFCNNTGPTPHRLIGNRINADTKGITIENSSGVNTAPFEIYNNMIKARIGGLSIVNLSMANYFRVYHNTICIDNPMLGRMSPGLPFSYLPSVQNGLSCKNNIFILKPGSDSSLSSAADIYTDTIANAVDFNVYNAALALKGKVMLRKDSIYREADFRQMYAGGDSSTSTLPQFISANDLHLSNGCQFRGTDLTAFVPLDIDGNPRSTHPYAGCDEYLSVATDIALTAIDSPVFPVDSGSYNMMIRVRNNGSTVITSFTASYIINGSTPVSKTWTGLLQPCSETSLTFDGPEQLQKPAGAMTLEVFTSLPNGMADDVTANDTMIVRQMQGLYTIGDTSSDFISFEDAFDALYKNGMGGSITFLVKPGTYQGPLYVNGPNIRGLSNINKLMIEGQNADSTIITTNTTGVAVDLHFCRYVTFRNFTVVNTNTFTGTGISITGSRQSPSYDGTGCAVRSCIVDIRSTFGNAINIDAIFGGTVYVDSNSTYGGLRGIWMDGPFYNSTYLIAYNQGTTINNNTINNASETGIQLENLVADIEVNNNRIYNQQLMESGIFFLQAIMVPANNISIRHTSVSGNRIEAKTKTGIQFSVSFFTTPQAGIRIFNNYVMNAQTALNVDPGTGIFPTYYEVYHNSFNMNTVVGSRPSTIYDGRWPGYGFYFANNMNATVYCRNNIFAVTASGGITIPLYFKTFTGVNTLNFNSYYNGIGSVLLQRGATSYTNTDFNTLAGGGDSSINVAPGWVSDTIPELVNGCVLRGTNLLATVPSDMAGKARTSSPSLGCYEYAAIADDISIDSLVAPSGNFTAGTQDLRVRIRNNGSNVVTSVNVTYDLNGGGAVTQLWTGSLAPCATAEVLFTGITFNTDNNLKIYTSDPNYLTDQNKLNDSFNLRMIEPMNGSYIIGSAPSDFTTFNEALTNLGVRGMSGAVTLLAKSGTYTEQVELLGNITGLSAANTLTIRSLAGHRDSVTLQYKSPDTDRNFVVKFNNVNYATIRDMSVKALDSAFAKVVEFVGGASFDTVDNCYLSGVNFIPPFGTYIGDKACVFAYFFGGGNNVFRNNKLENSKYGFFWNGISVTEPSANNIFEGNEITGILNSGMEIIYTKNIIIRNNKILATNGERAIACSSCDEYLEVTGNIIRHTNGGQAIAIGNSKANSGTPSLVANNVIMVNVSGCGLCISQPQSMNILHNSVLAQNGAVPAQISMTSPSGDNKLMNNVLANKGTGIALSWQTNTFSNVSDYNLLYTTGTTLIQRIGTPSNISNLGIWQTASGMDIHSVSTDPLFVNDTNLHMTGKNCHKTGLLLTEVPNDINDTVRIAPTMMGAYEYTGSGNDIAVDKILQPAFPVTTGYHDLIFRVRNEGRSVISSFDASYMMNNNLPYTQQWTGTLNGCDTVSIVFGGPAQVNVSGALADVLKVYIASPNSGADADMTNDTMTMPLTPALNGTYLLGGPGADFINFKTAEDALKTRGISGPVIFEVPAGLTFYETPVVITNVPGNDLYPVTFIKKGTGANPVLYGRTGTGTADAVVTLRGVNHVTFDGIDVSDTSANATNVTRMEYGFKVTNAEVTQGSTSNVIRNTKIKLNRTNTASIGILQTATTTGAAYTPASLAGANHNNRYENVKITNSYNGILLTGNATYPDSFNVITSSGNDTTTIGSVTANDIGNGALTAYGIQMDNQNSPEVSGCIVRNVTSSNSIVSGISLVSTANNSSYGNAVIRGNRVYNIKTTSVSNFSSIEGTFGIRIEAGINAKAIVSNNVIYDLQKANPSTIGNYILIRGISHCAGGWQGNANYYNNTVSVSSGTSLNASSSAFTKDGSGIVTITNNALVNTTDAQTGNARHFAAYFNAISSNGTLSSQNNLLWSGNTNGFIGGKGTTYSQTIAAWRSLTNDVHSICYQPNLSKANHLAPVATDSNVWALNGRGRHLDSTLVKTDVNMITRPLTKADGVPDIGAYEFAPTSVPPAATVIGTAAQGSSQVFLFGEDTVARVKWNGANIPPSLAVRQYTGTKPAGTSGIEPFMYFYTKMDADQSVAYDFDLDLFYQDAWTGTIASEENLRMAQTDANQFWGMSQPATSVDTGLNIISATQLDTFSLFTGTDVNVPLPVTMISFEGRLKSDDVLLNWITAFENNNKGFAVERSADGKRWMQISFVKGAGKTYTQQQYQYVDQTPFNSNTPVLHYRLKQVDVAGQYTYSNIVSIRRNATAEQTLNIFPNPFITTFAISVDALNDGEMMIELYDIQGRLTMSYNRSVSKGSNHLLLNNLEHLQQGVYFIKTTIGGETSMKKLIRQ